jgi:hypothetical protein
MANLTSNIRDTLGSTMGSEKFNEANKVKDEALEMMDDASQSANEIYARATDWFSSNRQIILSGATIAAVGLIGYFVGKSFSSKSTPHSEPSEDKFNENF